MVARTKPVRELSVRSREIFERAIKAEARKALNGTPEAVLDAVGAALSKSLYGDKAEKVRNRQALLLGWPEVRYLTQEIVKLAKARRTPTPPPRRQKLISKPKIAKPISAP